MDCYQQYLLISTNTRTYLCDTQKEQYRQIGKKLRDGTYGACFHYKHNLEQLPTFPASPRTGGFRHLKDDDVDKAFSSQADVADLKIFCARPGARMWEAKLDASVVCTHQLKSALARTTVRLLQISDDLESHLSVVDFSEWKSEDCNFGKIYMLANRLILISHASGFVVFNPENVDEVFWCSDIPGVQDFAVIRDSVYFWCENNVLRIFSLCELENLLLKCLFNKSYYVSAEICVEYSNDILRYLEHSKRIHLISILKEKLVGLGAEHLLKKLGNIMEAIDSRSEKNVSHKDATTGILNVNNLYQNQAEMFESQVQSPKVNTDTIESKSEEEFAFQILQQQYDISKVNSNVEIKKYQTLVSGYSPEALLELFTKFTQKSLEPNETKQWCQRQYLKYFSNDTLTCRIKHLETNSTILDFIVDAFTNVNFSPSSRCSCLFPLPIASQNLTAFWKIGCELVAKFWNCPSAPEQWKDLVNDVPYMWKHVLNLKSKQNIDISSILTLIIQFSDEAIIEEFLPKFSYDVWEDSSLLLVKLKFNGTCLNCDKKFTDAASTTLSWNSFAHLMLRSLGGAITIKLLSKYAEYIPSSALSVEFYQACIFSSTTSIDPYKSVLTAKALHANQDTSNDVRTQLLTHFKEIT